MSAEQFVGIEIGGTKLQLVCGDSSGAICQAERFKVASEKGSIGIQRQIEVALPRLLEGRRVKRIGLGFGGPIDWKRGEIIRSHQIGGWSGFNLISWLDEISGVQAVVDNDANVAALGEAIAGAGKGLDRVFYVTLGSGVGGGFVTDGNIYHGAAPGESEVGHLQLGGGRGILEERCSGWAIDRRIADGIKSFPAGVLSKLAGSSTKGQAQFLAAALDAGDPTAVRIMDELCGDLALGLSHVVHLFHPQIIVMGGGLSLVGEALRRGVEGRLEVYVMKAFHPVPKVVISVLGENAVPVGALIMAGRAGSM